MKFALKGPWVTQFVVHEAEVKVVDDVYQCHGWGGILQVQIKLDVGITATDDKRKWFYLWFYLKIAVIEQNIEDDIIEGDFRQ